MAVTFICDDCHGMFSGLKVIMLTFNPGIEFGNMARGSSGKYGG